MPQPPHPRPSASAAVADAESARIQALWEERSALLLESTGEGMFGVDMHGRCIFINRAGAQMLGYRPTEALQRNMHELIHHSHPDGPVTIGAVATFIDISQRKQTEQLLKRMNAQLAQSNDVSARCW